MEADRDKKLDFLKAISIIFVLLWHFQPIRISSVDTVGIQFILNNILYIFYHNICLLGVPIFYLVSLVLFSKNEQKSKLYINKRLKRIIVLFVFWSIVQALIFNIVNYACHYLGINIDIWNKNIKSIFLLIVMGGPSLPVVGDSVFYFLFNLFFLYLLHSFIFSRISQSTNYLIVIIILIFYLIVYIFKVNIPYWRLDNFIIYIPIAKIIKNNKLSGFRLFLAIFILAVIIENYMRILFGTNLPTYSRFSIFFGALSFYFFVASLDKLSLNIFFSLASKYSLGIYAIHKYWMLFFVVFFSRVIVIGNYNFMYISIFNIKISLFYFYIFLLSVIFMIFSISVMKKYHITNAVIS